MQKMRQKITQLCKHIEFFCLKICIFDFFVVILQRECVRGPEKVLSLA